MSRSYTFAAVAASISLLLIGFSQPLTAQSAPTMLLPGGALNQTTTPGITVTLSSDFTVDHVQFSATFDAVPNGYSVGNTTYTGWCVDAFADFAANPLYHLISTYDSTTLLNPPGGGKAQSPNWNKVNWVLNHKPATGTAPTWIVQQVIWKLLAGQYIGNVPNNLHYPAPGNSFMSGGDATIANNLYNAALAQGSFVPGPGQVEGLLLYLDGINPDGTSAVSNYIASNNNINPNAPPLNGLNGQTNQFQEVVIEVPVGPGSIGDFVWQDTNQNGIQDAGEPGIDGVSVKLCADSSCNTVLATTTTANHAGNDGYYQFTGLPLGTYYVSVDTSQAALTGPNLVATLTGQGTPATDSNLNPSQVILTAGTPVDETIDFGFTSPGASAIGDFVWQDNNGNGIQDSGEPGLSGLTVNLCSDVNCNTILRTTTTDQNGAYHFTGLFAGVYYVQVVTGSGFTATTPQVGFPANQASDSGGNVAGVPTEVNLPINFTDNTIDFGFIPPAQGAIGDFVFLDLNSNGIQDAGDVGINNVTVQLYDSTSKLVGTTNTVTNSGQDGYYQFTGLPAGSYTVKVDATTLPPTYTPTVSNAPGSNAANDSNGSPAPVTLATNLSVDETIDFGYVAPCTGIIGDFVWNDVNGNGIQDSGELGIPNVIVNLYGPNHVFITSTTTDANGAYHFNGLCAGSYTVEVVPPAGYTASPSKQGGNPATDSNGSPAPVTLTEDNTTDNTIDFGYYQLTVTCSSVTTGTQGVAFNSGPMTVSGGALPYTFSIVGGLGNLPAGLTLDATTGTVSGTPTASGTFTIQVTDANGTVGTGCAIIINPPLSVTCSSTTAGTQGVAFNSGAMNVTGGTLPYTFSIVGTLPAGLTLNTATGAVTGTPTASGSFSIQVTDANGAVGTSCAITINPPLSVTCSTTTTGTQGVAFNSGAMNVTGGTTPYTFSIVGTLPAGLTLNTSTGAVTGTPTASGTFSIQVTDAAGAVGTNCAITINPPLSVTCSTTTTGTQGVSFNSGAMTVTGGTTPYTFSIVGTLPAGLTLNTTTGAVTGTPTASGTFSIQVTDANGAVGTNCAITINPPPTVTCSTTTSGEVGVAFNSGAITVAGGTAPFTFSIATGSLPNGLSLNASTGAVTGTPTAAGSFTIQVTDANGAVGAVTCPFTIVPPPTVTCSTTNSGEVGVAFNSPAMTVAGGVAPYTFSIATGSLPNGLTLNATTGAITGTPTAAGTFTIQVKDANGVVATGTCPFTIVPPPTVTCSTTNSGEVGLAFNSPAMTVNGGTAPYTFSVATGSLPNGLTLNATTGAISGTPAAAGTFTIQVKDANGVVATGTCPFTIVPPPTVTCSTTNSGEVGVSFNSPAMTVAGGVAPFTFSVATGSLPNGLTLNASTGAITGTPTSAGTFTIQVKDANGIVAAGTCPFTIVAAPSVTCSVIGVGEVGVAFNSPAMTVAGGVAPYTFSVATGTLPNGLTLNASTGAITGTPTSAGTFTIKLTDGNGVVAPGTCPFTVVSAPSVGSARCGSVTSGEVGVAFNSPALTVSGGVAPYTFSIATGSLPNGLTLNPATGAITGTPTSAGSFTIQVTDGNGVVAATTCPFTIIPAPSVTCAAVSSGEVGVAFSSPAMAVSGGVAPYTFSIATGSLPNGLTLNAATGAISGTPTSAGTFTIKVTDGNGVIAAGTCPFTIAAGPSVACSAVTSGEVGAAFNNPAMTVSGGVGPYTFSIATGSLPNGLTLNAATGAISGTPTSAGTFTIKVTDGNGVVAAGSCPFTITGAPTVACSAVPSGEVGVAFNSPAMTVTGGVAPYTFSIASGSLPNGLTLNAATGAISGTPTSGGTFTIKVTDGNGVVATGTCPFTIVTAPSVTCSAVTSGEAGAPFNSPAMTVSGGVAPYTFSIATGSLPSGLTLNAATGAISGTPTSAGTFTIKVTDGNGVIATGTCPFTIAAGPSVACSAVNSGEVGLPFNSPAMTVTGGVAPYTFSIATGSLPNGLSLNSSTGAITGTPTSGGTFTIKVTDAYGVVAAGTCPFTIAAGPSVTCSAVNSGEVGRAFNSPAMTITGGVGPYTFSIATGSLPNGLSLNSATGAISGTPTSAGTFTIKVTDANGVAAPGSCPFTIVVAPSVACSTVTSGEVGLAFNSPAMTVTGGVAPYTFSVATGSLPNGLTLNASTGAITGTPTSAGTFTIKVTDANGVAASGSCPFTIIGGPSLTCPAVSSGLVGVAFSSPAMTVTGGTGPYKFSIGSGSLPTGLTLNASTGAITGTALSAGSFTIKVTDANGAVATTTCPFTFIAPPLVSCATGTATVGIPYSSNIPVTGGSGSFTFSLSAGSLPPGLSLNPSTGAITGTPTAVGTSGFTVKVVDNVSGAIAYSNCTSSCTNGGTVVNVNTYSVLGNLGNSHTYSVNSTSLIAYGFNNNGTPTALYGKNQSSTEQGLGIASDSDFEVNTSTFIQLDVSQLVAAGYTNAQILFTSVQSGESWVVYGSNTLGVLGTKLSGPGNTAQTLIAMPGYGTWKYIGIQAGYNNIDIGALAFTTPATKCSITVTAAPISVTCASGTAQVGVPYSSNVPVTGGSGSFTFSISAGALPPGLNLNPSNGAITGTPTTAGSSGFTVKVIDNVTGTVAYSACTSSCSGGGSAVTVDLTSALGSLGNSHVYSVNGTSLTAYGFNNNGTPTALYAKNDGPTEHGLGIDSDVENEINTSTFIQLDVSQLVAAGFTNAQISFSSVQAGESYIIYGSNTLGTLGTKLSGPGSLAETLMAMPGYGTWKYIGVQAGNKNIDIGGLAFTSPATTCNITVAPAGISSGDAATIGFWHNKNGQALILSLNGGPNSQNLANLLAGQLPYLYGARSSNDLTGQGNDDVAQLFQQFFNVSGQKTNAQIMAGALAAYVTSSTVAGTNAVQYGFNSSPDGTAVKTYNVGANGTAMGLVNNQSYTVLQLLQQANLTTGNGTFNANAFNTVFNGINTTGDIM